MTGTEAHGSDRRLEQQIQFVLELDRLKHVLRRSYLIGLDRRENSAEHSWHVAMVAMTLSEYAADPVDVSRVVRLLLVHDIVEIEAGDVAVYDTAARGLQEARERAAAVRLFGLLPPEQGAEFRALWEEFEAQTTADARFAKAVDRVVPILQNCHNGGRSWRELNVRAEQAIAVNRGPLMAGAPRLWEYVENLIREAVAAGILTA